MAGQQVLVATQSSQLCIEKIFNKYVPASLLTAAKLPTPVRRSGIGGIVALLEV